MELDLSVEPSEAHVALVSFISWLSNIPDGLAANFLKNIVIIKQNSLSLAVVNAWLRIHDF